MDVTLKRRIFKVYEKLANLTERKYRVLLKRDVDTLLLLNEQIEDLLNELRSAEVGSVLQQLNESERERLGLLVKKIKKWNTRNRAIIESSIEFVKYVYTAVVASASDKLETYNPYKAQAAVLDPKAVATMNVKA